MGTALLQEQPRAPLCLPSVGISPILQGQTPEGQGKPAGRLSLWKTCLGTVVLSLCQLPAQGSVLGVAEIPRGHDCDGTPRPFARV